MMKGLVVTRVVLAVAAAACAGLLAGCGVTPRETAAAAPPHAAAFAIGGRVHGGQQPVSGATIKLYAVGNTGTASASTPLLTSSVTTDGYGNFSITGLWACTNTAVYGADPLLYLTASGGNPGLSAGTNNGALMMMTAIGRCSTLTPASFLFVNEVTTVAAAYALAPFMTDATHVGASGAYMAGLSNAFGTVSALVNPATGISPGPGAVSGVAVPSLELNSLSNSIATCINSDGNSGCGGLFAATTPAGGSAPTDTLRALLNIAAAPLRNVSSIYAQASSVAPFQPQLSAAPNDWTVALTLSGSGLAGPQGIALDSAGNAWVANASGAGVTAFSNQGVALTGVTPHTANNSIYGAQSVAVDRSGNVWVADTLLSTVVKLTVAGSAVTGATTFTAGLSGPTSLAVDGGNRVWVTNFADGSVTNLSNNGGLLNGSPIIKPALQVPAGVAIDTAGNAWVTDNQSAHVFAFNKNGALLAQNGYSDGALIAPVGVAIDAAGRVWVADNGDASVSLFAADGTPAIATPVTGGGINAPTVVAIDGAGTAWIANNASPGALTKISSSTTGATGGLGSLNLPAGVAIDASGNLWVTNSGDSTIAKFIGLATPVLTPLAANLPALP